MKYKLVQRGNPQKPEEPKNWFASPVNQGSMDMDTLSDEIAGRSSLTRGDVRNVIENFIDLLPQVLKDGKSVKLGKFGSFRLSVYSKGLAEKEKFNTSLIDRTKVIFTPGTGLKEDLKTVKFELDK